MMKNLDAARVSRTIGSEARQQFDAVDVLQEIDSTNRYLLEGVRPSPGRYRAALAERQTAGRGRQGRRWHSPEGSGLCLSVACTFRAARPDCSALTLAVGCGLAGLLRDLGAAGIRVKWPNDLVTADGKLGGILTEARSAGGQISVVVGLGLNVDFADAPRPGTRIGRATDLASCMADVPERSLLAGRIIGRLAEDIARFDAHGFAPFEDVWRRFDFLAGRRVVVRTDATTVSGTCEGIDPDGALAVRDGGRRHSLVSGTVSLAGSLAEAG